MIWIWHGTSSNGDFRRGEMNSDSREDAVSLLEGLGITIISVDEKGAAPAEQSQPVIPAPPPPSEAAIRVASTIDAMANHVANSQQEMLELDVDMTKPPMVQEMVCCEFSKAQKLVNQKLADGARVVHMAMSHDSKGVLQVVVVLEKEEERL